MVTAGYKIDKPEKRIKNKQKLNPHVRLDTHEP
jgi:hypothetical protein